MSLEIAVASGATAMITEKTVEVSAGEAIMVSSGLSAKIAAVADNAVKEMPKKIKDYALDKAVYGIVEEIDSSTADAIKIGKRIYSFANLPTWGEKIEEAVSSIASEIVKEDQEPHNLLNGIHNVSSTISSLNRKFDEVIDRAKSGFRNFEQEKTKKENFIEAGKLQSNSMIENGGNFYSTDDNGVEYKVNKYQLLSDKDYTIDGISYKTDNMARITCCNGMTRKMPEGERDNIAQKLAGDGDRKEGDQGAHILARVLGGPKGVENMIALRGKAINQSVYKRMENEISRALDEGKKVPFHADISYKKDSQRPSKIETRYSIDGKEKAVWFDNDEGSTELFSVFEQEIEENDVTDLKNEILDAKKDGEVISIVSVKIDYDLSGKAEKVIVTTRNESIDQAVNEDRVFSPREVE